MVAGRLRDEGYDDDLLVTTDEGPADDRSEPHQRLHRPRAGDRGGEAVERGRGDRPAQGEATHQLQGCAGQGWKDVIPQPAVRRAARPTPRAPVRPGHLVGQQPDERRPSRGPSVQLDRDRGFDDAVLLGEELRDAVDVEGEVLRAALVDGPLATAGGPRDRPGAGREHDADLGRDRHQPAHEPDLVRRAELVEVVDAEPPRRRQVRLERLRGSQELPAGRRLGLEVERLPQPGPATSSTRGGVTVMLRRSGPDRPRYPRSRRLPGSAVRTRVRHGARAVGRRRARPRGRDAGNVRPVPPVEPHVTDRDLALSVLDLVPVRGGQTTGQALQASLALARTADRAGYRRYWVAEHHNMPAVAATNPALLISMVAAATERIRVGSGGVMLPNHAPLVVAEQFALLEAAYPDRIDLGIGRAPGSDPVTSWALRHGAGRRRGRRGEPLPRARRQRHRDDGPGRGGARPRRPQLRAPRHPPGGLPAAGVAPRLLRLLGAARREPRAALRLRAPLLRPGAPRRRSRSTGGSSGPATTPTRPRTFLTVNACVADTAEEAERLARPYLLSMVALRTGGEMRPQLTVEEAEQVTLPPQHEAVYDGMRRRWVVGTPETALAELEQLAATYDVDEVMLHPVSGSSAADPADRTPEPRAHPRAGRVGEHAPL